GPRHPRQFPDDGPRAADARRGEALIATTRRAAFLVLCLLLLTAGERLLAAQDPAPANPPAAAQSPAAGADPWGFDDEQQEETWVDILRPQWVDIGLTTALIGFALFGFSRRSKTLKYATLAATVAYLGFTKGTMISVTDLFRFVDRSLPDYKSGG